jgi:hypothetical protein
MAVDTTQRPGKIRTAFEPLGGESRAEVVVGGRLGLEFRSRFGRLTIARSYSTKLKKEKEVKTKIPRAVPVLWCRSISKGCVCEGRRCHELDQRVQSLNSVVSAAIASTPSTIEGRGASRSALFSFSRRPSMAAWGGDPGAAKYSASNMRATATERPPRRALTRAFVWDLRPT